MTKQEKEIEVTIRAIRDSFVGSEHIYKNGSCWYFANILRTIYGGDIVCTSEHCLLRLGGKYYDIEGEVNPKKYDSEVFEVINELNGTKTEKIDLFNMIRSFNKI